MKHAVTMSDLDCWLKTERWDTFACSYGKDSAKSFETDHQGVFRVRVHGETVFLGADRASAISAYNSAN